MCSVRVPLTRLMLLTSAASLVSLPGASGSRAESSPSPVTHASSEAWVDQAIPPSAAKRFVRVENSLVPIVARSKNSRPVRVAIADRADGWTSLADELTGVVIRFRPLGSTSAPATIARGLVRYSSALPHADLLQRPARAGVEDFVAFRDGSALGTAGVVRYQIDVSRVAGLRLVGDMLEFLDAYGAPRLRVAPPYLATPDGNRHSASLGLEGCNADRSPAAPWGRPVVGPESAECVLAVRWDPARVGRVALLDPGWTATDDMAVDRREHTATTLTDGRVLVVGERPASGSGRSCELYDPATETWAATGPSIASLDSHSATRLGDGRVLVVRDDHSELYNPTTGTWIAGPVLPETRSNHAAAELPDGRALIVGGDTGSIFLSSAVIFDPAGSGTWVAVADSMREPRQDHAATVLADGRVLVTGGVIFGTESATADVFDPATESFSPAGSMAHARANHAAILTAGGRVLAHGGAGVNGYADVWDPATNSWTSTGTSTFSRYWQRGVAFSDGSVLVTGGYGHDSSTSLGDDLASTELWSDTTGAWTDSATMLTPRDYHTATLLSDDGTTARVLVTGGHAVPFGFADGKKAELLDTKLRGSSCSTAIDCASGHCIDGFCCDSACDGLCRSCSVALGAALNGVCSPVATGADPDEECPTTDVSTCGTTGVCDGAGACALHAAGTECKPGKCDHPPTGYVLGVTYACDGQGKCKVDQKDCCSFDGQGQRVCSCQAGKCGAAGTGGTGGVGGTLGAGGGSGFGGTVGGGPAGNGGTAVNTAPASSDGGCSCSAPRPGRISLFGAVAVGILALLIRRREVGLADARTPRLSTRRARDQRSTA